LNNYGRSTQDGADTERRASSSPVNEVLSGRLRVLIRLSGWPVLFAAGNGLSDTAVRNTQYNTVLATSFAFVILTQLLFTLRLPYRGVDLLPPLTDAIVLFTLSYLSGGLFSPLQDAYLLFIVVHALGLYVRGAVGMAFVFTVSYALLELVDSSGARVTASEAMKLLRQTLYLFWTAITVGVLARIVSSTVERYRLTAAENALLYERSVRAGNDLRSVLNSTVNGIVMVGPDLRLRFVNSRLGDMFSDDLSDAVGKQMSTIIRDRLRARAADPDAFEARLNTLYGDLRQEAVDEVELTTPQRRVLSRFSGPVEDDAGVLLGRIEVYSDVTAQRDADRLKDEFLSVAAHELKTPITSLKAYAQLLRRKPLDQLSPQLVANALDTIDRQSEQLSALVDDLLDVSRAETGYLELRVEQLDLGRVVSESVGRISATERSHEFEIVRADAATVRADPVRIEQVAANLLTNAVKYSSPGSTISVSIQNTGAEAIVCIQDTGIGIPEEKLTHVFDRFYQAHTTVQYSRGGLGIGLSICLEIIKRHGGRIWIESEVDKGSTFYFAMPISNPEDARGNAPDSQ